MKKLVIILLLFITFNAIADSPLTSTPFHTAYSSVKEVQYALDNGLDKKMLKFLGSSKKSVIHKIAIINALSWGNKELVGEFESYLLSKRKGLKQEVFEYLKTVSNETPQENEQTKLLSADDLICWAYLQTMGDYNQPALGMRGGFLAFQRDNESMAHMVPFALLAAQKAFDSNWCTVYQIPHKMLEEGEFTKNKISDAAMKVIMDYINLYKGDCKE